MAEQPSALTLAAIRMAMEAIEYDRVHEAPGPRGEALPRSCTELSGLPADDPPAEEQPADG